MEEKVLIRKELIRIRRTISRSDKEAADRIISERLIRLPEYISADRVFLYASSADEVSTDAIIIDCLKNNKQVFLPRVLGDGIMDFYRVTDFGAQVEAGYMGIAEPIDSLCQKAEGTGNDVIIIPGVGFDRSFHRMGYGKGFYDRYLEAHAFNYRIALAYSVQLRDCIPYDNHDELMDIIITERELWKREKDN